jgi:7-cyano-7-deazaguanine synthase
MALVILSGGQDSTTCLFWAKNEFEVVEAVFFDYGQRHLVELEAAQTVAKIAGVELTVVPLPGLGLVKSALTDRQVPVQGTGGLNGLPSSFVPGRNLVFATVAAGLAASKGMQDIVLGVSQADYSGYPDCQERAIFLLQGAIRAGLANPCFIIHTPLMNMTKAESIHLARRLSGDCWRALKFTHTCYEGVVGGCGKCPACVLRAKGFTDAGISDPMKERQ